MTRWLGIWLILAVSFAFSAQSPTMFVVRNVRVFDGVRVIPQTTVMVQNGRIAAVGPAIRIPSNAQVIEGKGKTLLPGLIDAHTHTFLPEHLKQALVFGVTTELDMFTAPEFAHGIKKQQASGTGRDLADFRSAGMLVTAPGGHGTEYPIKVETIRGPEEAQVFVDARLAEGSDYIKVIYDNGSVYGINFPTITKETLAAVIAATHKRGKMTVVHVSSMEYARDAIEAGADGLAHLFADRSPDDEFVALAASKKVFVIPTLTVLQSVCGIRTGESLTTDARLDPYLASGDIENLKRSFPVRPNARNTYGNAEEAVRKLRSAGVAILAGSDVPNFGTAHGASIHREMELLVQAGLTPPEALAAATSVPADRFGLNDRGRIAAGKRADLVLVNGDPTTDIKATRDIISVWKIGVPVNRVAFRAQIQKERQLAKAGPAAPGGLESGLISDFDDGKTSAKFGAGWQVSTDSIAGGSSTADMKVVEGGAEGSKHSLLVTGQVAAGGQFAWAGAMFSPGAQMMQPANLSSKKEITFWTKGDGKTYNIMVFAQSRGFTPAVKTFIAGTEWKQYTFKISDFDGMDGRDVMGIFFGAGPPAGKFEMRIDEVRLR